MNKKENILIVDDNNDMLDLVERQLKTFKYHTYKASSVNEAIEVLKNFNIDLLISDLNMPNINGIELLKYADEHYPFIPKLVMSGNPSVPTVVTSIKSGALDYLIKPFTMNELQEAILSSLEKSMLTPKKRSTKTTVNEKQYGNIIGQSDQYKDLVDIIERVKNAKVNVLIEGESGTGKELIAKAIHYLGEFSNKPFISVNCGAIPESLMESELFGHVKGAFTGALESKIGLFQAANGGTIFLDEIGNAPLAVQTRLLRVVQEKEVTRIGASAPEKIDIRIISATNNNLNEMVANGTFREDLYYRINVINIKTTPLRERKDDIILLANNFIAKYTAEFKKPQLSIDNKVIEVLLRYSWPGNIRELENIIQRMIIMSDETITIQQVPDYLKYNIPPSSEKLKSLKEYEKDQILKVLNAVNNNKTQAAKILQIDRKTLNQKIL